MKDRVSMIRAVSPEQVFVMGGINRLEDGNTEQCLEQYSALLNSIAETVPDADIYLQSVLPVSAGKERAVCHNTTIIRFNEGIKKLADERGLTYIDLYSLYELNGEMDPSLTVDGVHLQPEAYKRWADAIRIYIPVSQETG